MGRNYSNKNLTELEIGNIEYYLNNKLCPAEIGLKLNRDPSGIRKEIKNYSSYFGETRKCSNCLNKDNCHEKYLCEKIVDKIKCSQCKYCFHAPKVCSNYKIEINCELLKKNHHVCNGCDLYHKCKLVKIKYHAETAIKMRNAVQRISRIDVKLDKFPTEFKIYISTLIKNGISPDVVLNTLPEEIQMLKVSTPTLYDWIDKGYLDCCNLDLRNKVSRVRYGSSTVKRNTVKCHQLNGRSIENLTEEEKTIRPLGIAEFDIVEGIKNGELLFTIMIPCFSLMLAFLSSLISSFISSGISLSISFSKIFLGYKSNNKIPISRITDERVNSTFFILFHLLQ